MAGLFPALPALPGIGLDSGGGSMSLDLSSKAESGDITSGDFNFGLPPRIPVSATTAGIITAGIVLAILIWKRA